MKILLVSEESNENIHDSVNYSKFMTALREFMQLKHHLQHARLTPEATTLYQKEGVPNLILDVGRTVCPACTGSSKISASGKDTIEIRVSSETATSSTSLEVPSLESQSDEYDTDVNKDDTGAVQGPSNVAGVKGIQIRVGNLLLHFMDTFLTSLSLDCGWIFFSCKTIQQIGWRR
jgi:hypothetical protein